MKSLVCFHQNNFEVICNVMHMKFVICFHYNRFELIYNVIYMKFVICFQQSNFTRRIFFFFLVFVVKFYLQATVVTKIPLVALDKSHAILVTNNKGYWMKKGQQIQILWLHYICIVTCDQNATIWSLLKANDVLPCVLIFHYLKLLLLFWNNLGCLILFNSHA
jgi:hypothetical protein